MLLFLVLGDAPAPGAMHPLDASPSVLNPSCEGRGWPGRLMRLRMGRKQTRVSAPSRCKRDANDCV
jgi:hypothetical protein